MSRRWGLRALLLAGGAGLLILVIAAPIAWYLVSPLFLSKTVDEAVAAPASGQAALRGGRFHAVDHAAAGTATILRLPDGKRVLRLEDFEVDNGPDLYVYLSAAPDANDSATIKGNHFVSLGRLKGNKGNQNYELPDDLDVAQFHSVSIWCQRFSVNFATAPLR